MKKFLFTLCVIIITLFSFVKIYTEEKKINLAVIPFDDSITDICEKENAGSIISSSIEKIITGVDRFYVRTPDAIKDYINKLELSQTGLLNPESMKGNCSLLKINYLTVGSISKFDNRYEIDARTVNINSWKIIHSHGCSTENINTGMNEIGWYITEQFTNSYLTEREKEDLNTPTVSVFKFRDYNKKADDTGFSGAFAEILNSELGAFNLITTIERKYAGSLIKEKELEMTGVIDNDNSDAAFSLKNIEYKMSGDIRIFNDVVCINYTLHNTADGRVIFIGHNEISSHLALRPAAKSIAATVEDVLNNKLGSLKLDTYPSEADVYIDDAPLGKTPITASLTKGTHQVVIKMTGYEPYKENIAIEPKKTEIKKVKLQLMSLKLLQTAYELESKGDWDGAVNAYKQFIEKYNDTVEADNAYYRKGHIELINQKKYSDALNSFQALVNRYPDTMIRAEGYYGMVQTYIAMNNKSKAKETLKYLLEKYSNTSAADEASKLKL